MTNTAVDRSCPGEAVDPVSQDTGLRRCVILVLISPTVSVDGISLNSRLFDLGSRAGCQRPSSKHKEIRKRTDIYHVIAGATIMVHRAFASYLPACTSESLPGRPPS